MGVPTTHRINLSMWILIYSFSDTNYVWAACVWSRCKISACEVRACAESKISRLLFAFSPPFFFRFSCLIFFSLAGHLVGLILMGRVFRKAFRILGLGERKGRWAMEQDFHGDFQVKAGQCYMVFCLFLRCPWLNCAHSRMVWKISSLCTS